MNELTPEQVERLDQGVREWEDNGGPILTHLAPVVAAMLTDARADERERIAASVRDLTAWTWRRGRWHALTELADSIARGES